jgi:hypothetical protein
MKERIAFIFRFDLQLRKVNPEDGDDSILQNAGNHLQHYTATQPRRPQLTSSSPRTPQMSEDISLATIINN